MYNTIIVNGLISYFVNYDIFNEKLKTKLKK